MSRTAPALDQQVIVITGASSGIGLATALAAAKQGAKVVLASRSGNVLKQIVAHVESSGGQALAVVADVGDRNEVDRVATAAVERFQRIDTWVNNAGVAIFGRIDEVDEKANRRLFDTNYWGVVNGSLAALPHLQRSGGVLINVGSELSDAYVPLQGMYSASKHAVKGFTDSLRVELKADGSPVEVVLIQPSAINTPYPEHAANYISQEPKLPSPIIEPENVADAILKAATAPSDAVRVGAQSVLDTTLAKLFPGLFKKFAAMQIGRQQRSEPPHAREGTLWKASEDGRVHGRGNANTSDTGEARALNTR